MANSAYNISNQISFESCSTNRKPLSYKIMLFGFILIILSAYFDSLIKGFYNFHSLRLQYALYPLSFFVFYLSSMIYISSTKLFSKYNIIHKANFFIYTLLLIFMLAYGILRENPVNTCIHEAMWFFAMGAFLLLGSDQRSMNSIFKIATVVFWISFIFCLLSFDIRMATDEIHALKGIAGNDGRYTDSVAFRFFRPFTQVALPLFLYGWFEKNIRWHYLQIFSLAGYIVINVMLFKFRGALIFSLIVSLAAVFLPAGLTRKLKLTILAIIALFFVIGWMSTEGGQLFTERMQKFDDSKTMVDYRLPETERYLKVVGYEWLIGRGFGGNFKYNSSGWGKTWSTLHIGWMSFTLKGGLPLMISLLVFFLAWVRKISTFKRGDPFLATAFFWTPILFVYWIVNPIGFHVANVPIHGLSFLLLAQLGIRANQTAISHAS